jgi:flagellar hook-associated protein 2
MASAVSFQGLSSGIQTDAIVNAILQQEGLPLQRLQARQTANTKRSSALTSLRSNMSGLATSLATLMNSSFDARSVTSSDANGSYVTASASGAAAGSYDLKVSQVATRGRISATLDGTGAPTNLAVADPNATAIFSGASASFAIQGTDGVIKTITLGSGTNSLNALKDAINASGAGVTAAVVNTGSGANPYQLVVTAKETGTGTTSGRVTLADITAGGSVNTLGIAAGTVDSPTSPTTLTGGLLSAAAQDAVFTLNGIQLTRKSNVVTDAVDGMTFTLKQGGQATATTFTVAQDKGAVTTAMQDVVSKYNALLKVYRDNTTTTKDSSGNVVQGPLTNNTQARSFLQTIREALTGKAAGLSAGAAYGSPAELGVKTNQDGTLSLDVATFQKALDADPAAVKRVFAFSGDSTNGVVAFSIGSSKTTTGEVGFNITSYASGGAVSGDFTVGGNTYTLTGSGGVLKGAAGTPLEGLVVTVSGTGTGTLTLSRGVGQAARDRISEITSAVTGTLSVALQNITDQNRALASQIQLGQDRLDRRRIVLEAQFSRMESVISQLQQASGSLSKLG